MSSSFRQSAEWNGCPFRAGDRRIDRHHGFWRVDPTDEAIHYHSPGQYKPISGRLASGAWPAYLSVMPVPLLVAERPQGDIERPFRLSSEFAPAGDQPQAIDELCEGLGRGDKDQVLLGVTGSGKTFTM